jgi:AcrR family transcriptional regulator
MTEVSDRSPGFPGGGQEERIIDAALSCIARWGVAKTTLDDVAREASCSRATVYRVFPGGKEALLEAVGRREMARFFEAVTGRLQAADSLEDLLIAGITEAGRRLRDHRALRFLVAHEPEMIIPRLGFTEAEAVLGCASAVAAPYLARWLADADALRAAEWVVRLVLSYSMLPNPEVDLTDEESVRGLVRTFVLPGLTPLVTS